MSAGFFSPDGRQCLYERQATRAALEQALPGASYLHFACHGAFTIEGALDSALYLAGDEKLTLRDLLDGKVDLSSVRLVVLSACQTGQSDILGAPEEVVGFPAGFLQSGVPTVLSTLWPVNDISTALLLARFYRYHVQDGHDPLTALSLAQRWLRNATADTLSLVSLYQRLYQESGQQDARAFRAMRYYRSNPDIKPFADRYYWAAFVLTGVGGP